MKDDTKQDKPKKPYVTPKLIRLGSIRELTHGSGGSGSDSMAQMAQ